MRSTMRMASVLGIGLLALSAGCARCGGDLQPSTARVSIQPEELSFGWVVLGEQARATASVRNVGRAPVDVSVVADGAVFEVAPRQLFLEVGEERSVTVTFRPTSPGSHTGKVEVRSAEVLAELGLQGEAHPCAAPEGCVGQRFDEASGQCVEEVLADGAACQTGCIPAGTCSSGVCAGEVRSCDDANLCTRDVCVEGTGCTHADESAQCPAVTQECRVAACDADTGCGAEPAPDGTTCGSGCMVGACQAGTCVPNPEACDDGNACTDDVCDAVSGTCAHTDTSAQCPASTNGCLTAVCEPATGCGFGPVEDGFPCGEATCSVLPQCLQGQCIDKPAPPPGPCGCSTALPPPPRLDVTVHACKVMPAGTVECWGMNTVHQLGVGGANRNSPVVVPGVSGVVGVGAATSSTFAWTADGGTYWWGRLHDSGSEPPGLFQGPPNVVAASGGGGTECVLTSDGSVWCYGLNLFGVLGDGTTTPRSSWGKVPNLPPAVGFAEFFGLACAILEDRSVRCWGRNDSGGSMGIGGDGGPLVAPVTTPTPARLADGGFVHGVVEVSPGVPSCVRTLNNEVLCAGIVDRFQPGAAFGSVFGNTTYFTPVKVPGCPVQINTAGDVGSPGSLVRGGVLCALIDGGTIQCAGYNDLGALGTGDTGQPDGGWSNASGLSGVTEVRTTGYVTCALLEDGGHRCWGTQGLSRLLGDGTNDPYRYAP